MFPRPCGDFAGDYEAAVYIDRGVERGEIVNIHQMPAQPLWVYPPKEIHLFARNYFSLFLFSVQSYNPNQKAFSYPVREALLKTIQPN